LCFLEGVELGERKKMKFGEKKEKRWGKRRKRKSWLLYPRPKGSVSIPSSPNSSPQCRWGLRCKGSGQLEPVFSVDGENVIGEYRVNSHSLAGPWQTGSVFGEQFWCHCEHRTMCLHQRRKSTGSLFLAYCFLSLSYCTRHIIRLGSDLILSKQLCKFNL
jgi:hypothetical protein